MAFHFMVLMSSYPLLFHIQTEYSFQGCTANMCSEITVEVHWKNCNFEKLQFFTVDLSSLYFLQVKNCNFSIIFHVVYFALNWMLILQVFTVFQEYNKKTVKIELKNCKFGLSKLFFFFLFVDLFLRFWKWKNIKKKIWKNWKTIKNTVEFALKICLK